MQDSGSFALIYSGEGLEVHVPVNPKLNWSANEQGINTLLHHPL